MNLSGLASALGAGFGGYSVDRQRELQQAMLNRSLENADFDRMLKLHSAGAAPVADVQAAIQAAQGQTKPMPAMPLARAEMPRAMRAEPAPTVQPSIGLKPAFAPQELAPGATFQVPTSKGTQAYQWLPSMLSPAGQALRFAEERQSAQQQEMEKRQLAVTGAKESQKAADEAKAKETIERRAYERLKTDFGSHPWSTQPFAPDRDYSGELKDQADIRKLAAQGDAQSKRLAMQLQIAKMRQAQNQDAQKMLFAYNTALPSVQPLEEWFAEDRNPGKIASTLGQLPVVGNAITGFSDSEFQEAQQHARVIAQQYAETQPKMRFQPNTLEVVERQIMPQMGDTPKKRKAKLKLVHTWMDALKTRAGAAQAAPGYDDIPEE